MSVETIEVRPTTASEAGRAAEAYARFAGPAGAAHGRTRPAVAHTVVAVRRGEIVGVCGWAPGAGRCATVVAPRLVEWDEAVAGRLIRGAASASA
ncbi:MAG: hypothetical protein WBD52_01050, partial [Phycisphaerae bacterium]